jgi:hypothetical protein
LAAHPARVAVASRGDRICRLRSGAISGRVQSRGLFFAPSPVPHAQAELEREFGAEGLK